MDKANKGALPEGTGGDGIHSTSLVSNLRGASFANLVGMAAVREKIQEGPGHQHLHVLAPDVLQRHPDVRRAQGVVHLRLGSVACEGQPGRLREVSPD